MLFTGDKIDGREAEKLGLVLKAVPAAELDAEVEVLAERMATVPTNQLMMHKLMINQAIEAMGLKNTQMLATIFDGITRHTPEGMNFKKQAEAIGWKEAVPSRPSMPTTRRTRPSCRSVFIFCAERACVPWA